MGVSLTAVIAAATEAASAASAAVAALPGTIAGALGPTGLGIGAETAGTLGNIGAGALEGGALGAITNPRNPLKGAESGAISGGVMGGAAPFLSSALDIGMTGADALAGAAGGSLGALATGGKPLQGALAGGASGAAMGALGLGPQAQTATPTPTPAGGGGPVGSAAGAAAPASVAPTGPDVTQPVATGAPASLQTPAASLAAAPVPGNVGAGAAAGGGTTNVGGAATTTLPASATPVGGEVAGKQVGNLGVTADAATKTTGSVDVSGAKEGGGIFNKLADNPGALLSAAGMGASLLGGNKLPKQAGILSSQAADLVSRGKRMENYLETGTLPPGVQQNIDAATAAGEAAIRQGYANRGMTGSSAEAQDIQNLKITAAGQGQDIAFKLMQQGVNDTQLGNDLYKQLLDIQMQQDKEFSDSISGFASSLANIGRPYQFAAGQPTATG